MRLILLLILVASISVRAQETTVSETNAPSVKWYQINTTHFRLLYPKGFEVQAQRMANTLETIREPEGKTIGSVPRKISVILQNQSALSNAFVTITPRRAEFYAMPSQNYNFSGNNDWLNLLATHEYRHMAQFQHATRGVNKVIKYAFGNNALAGMAYVAAPQWFWEGDAVATETAFTESGRGRIPNFDLVLRTNLQEGRVFNYHKQYLRSYKNNINDHYVLGYHMVSYLRKKTGDPNIWDKVTARSWNIPFIPFRFSSALKMETGMHVKDLYNEMAADLQKEYKAQRDTLQLTTFEKINPRTTSAYTDYKYPQELEDGSLLVQKSGIGDIEQLVVLKNGEESKVYTEGVINESGMVSATNSRVVWNEYRFDPRWLVRNYSVIVGYDIGTGVKKVIGSKSRYASAAISPDGYKVATVETGTDYQTRLLILDYFSGAIIKSFDNPENDFVSMPRWTKNGKEIVALLTNKTGKAIVKFDVTSGAVTKLTEFSNENVGYPVLVGNYIFYNSPVSGIDNIYALDLQSGNRFQVTCSKYGSYNPIVSRDGKWIYYNDQGRDGLDVVKIPFDQTAWRPWKSQLQADNGFKFLVEQEGHPSVLNNLQQQQYSSKRYHRWKRMINPYSWGGTVSTTLTSAFVGVTSQDLLSTTTINAGYVFDKTENTGAWKASVSYQGWYPIIDFSASQSARKVNEGTIAYGKIVGKDTVGVNENLTFKWDEKTVQTGLRLPFVTTTSKYIGSLTFSNYVGYTSVSGFQNNIDGGGRLFPTNYPQYIFRDLVDNGNLIYNQFSMFGYRLLKQSRRDINSKWGQVFYLNFYNTPYGGDFSGKNFSFYSIGYLPGIFKHHSLWGYWGFQSSDIPLVDLNTGAGLNNYVFRNGIPLPRGLSVGRYQKFYSMSGNYTLPVWYPDIAIGPLLNVQRMRVNGFLDYGFGSSVFTKTITQSYMSTGVEVKFDVNVMRLLPQLDIGFRYSMGIKPSTTLFEVLVGTINF
jgi:hypothetical protein